jgi:hypothetical protein
VHSAASGIQPATTAATPGAASTWTAKLGGHDPHARRTDVLERLPTHPASRIEA